MRRRPSIDFIRKVALLEGAKQTRPRFIYIYTIDLPPPSHPLLARPASPDYRAIDRQLTPGSAVAVLLAAPERHAKYQ